MILHNEDELHELNNEICETFVVRSAINDLLLISETEHADLAFQGWPEAENEEGTEVDRRLGWVSDLREIEWPLTFVGTSSGEHERKQQHEGVRVLVPFTGAEFNYDEADALVIGERLSQGLFEFAQKGGNLNEFTARAKVVDYAADILHGLVIEVVGPHIDEAGSESQPGQSQGSSAVEPKA